MKTFIVIGLGLFGSAAAEQLYDMGHEVIVVDRDEEAVNHLADHCTHAAIGDAREIEVLRAVGAAECQYAIVAMGEDLAASVLITMNLLGKGVRLLSKRLRNVSLQAYHLQGAERAVSAGAGAGWRRPGGDSRAGDGAPTGAESWLQELSRLYGAVRGICHCGVFHTEKLDWKEPEGAERPLQTSDQHSCHPE